MPSEMKETIDKNAQIFADCIESARDHIPKDVLGKGLELTPEVYQKIATSLYIDAKTQERRSGNSNGSSGESSSEPSERSESGGGNYDGPASKDQVNLVTNLKGEINKLSKDEGDAIVHGYLDDNGADAVAKLTKSQASSLCTTLIEAKKSMRRK